VNGAIVSLAELVWDARCPACGDRSVGLCEACHALLPRAPTVAAAVAWAGPYDGVLRSVVIAAKERQSLPMVRVLARLLAGAVGALVVTADLGGRVTLVPAPTARARVIRRGIDLPEALARGAAGPLRRAGLSVGVERRLRLVGSPADQVGLSAAERRRNVQGTFAWRGPPIDGTVIVVDDVMTTGATMTEALRACATAGTQVAGGVVVARTPGPGQVATNLSA